MTTAWPSLFSPILNPTFSANTTQCLELQRHLRISIRENDKHSTHQRLFAECGFLGFQDKPSCWPLAFLPQIHDNSCTTHRSIRPSFPPLPLSAPAVIPACGRRCQTSNRTTYLRAAQAKHVQRQSHPTTLHHMQPYAHVERWSDEGLIRISTAPPIMDPYHCALTSPTPITPTTPTYTDSFYRVFGSRVLIHGDHVYPPNAGRCLTQREGAGG